MGIIGSRPFVPRSRLSSRLMQSAIAIPPATPLIAPWLAGPVLIGFIGRHGEGAKNLLPNWIDIAVVIVFALTIFYWAVSLTMSGPDTLAAISRDANQLAGGG